MKLERAVILVDGGGGRILMRGGDVFRYNSILVCDRPIPAEDFAEFVLGVTLRWAASRGLVEPSREEMEDVWLFEEFLERRRALKKIPGRKLSARRRREVRLKEFVRRGVNRVFGLVRALRLGY